MEPFRELVKANRTFLWDKTLEKIFQESKSMLISKVMEGIGTFDTSRQTCLQPDWCQTGLGYLLLQKYGTCPLDNAPVCCPDGWRLVYAGSRFTHDSNSTLKLSIHPQKEKHLRSHGHWTMPKPLYWAAQILLLLPITNLCLESSMIGICTVFQNLEFQSLKKKHSDTASLFSTVQVNGTEDQMPALETHHPQTPYIHRS